MNRMTGAQSVVVCMCVNVTTQYEDSVCVCMSSECCPVTASVVPWDYRNVSWDVSLKY